VNVTVADSGRMELTSGGLTLVFTLYSGYNYLERTDQRQYRQNRPFQKTKFREEVRSFNLMDFAMTRTNEDLFKNNYSMLNLNQLRKAEDSLVNYYQDQKKQINNTMVREYYFYSNIDSSGLSGFRSDKPYLDDLLADFNKSEKDELIDDAQNSFRKSRQTIQNYRNDIDNKETLIFKHQAELHRKYTLSVACFVLFFIGAPLGAIIRRGGLGLPVVVSVLLFVLFHIISITGEKSVKSGVIDANIGMWVAPVILLPLGIFLTFKATTDSPLLDSDAWRKTFNRFFKAKVRQ
jgi:lipopolysaccharide export system permease protein